MALKFSYFIEPANSTTFDQEAVVHIKALLNDPYPDVRRSSGGQKLIVRAKNSTQAQIMDKAKILGGIKIKVTKSDGPQFIQGIIHCPWLVEKSDENILDELKSQGVVQLRNLSRKVDGKIIRGPIFWNLFQS